MGNYNNLHKYFHSLPIDEYTTGNFKNAQFISDLHYNLNQSLLNDAINNRNDDIHNKEKNNLSLLEQKEILEIKYNDIDKIIKGLYKAKKEITNKIIEMYPKSKSWEEFCNCFDKNISILVNPITIQIDSGKYSDEQVNILNSIFDDVEKIRGLQTEIQEKSEIRSNYKHQLDGKKNHNSIQSQLNEKTSTISEYYKNEILSYFNLRLESNNNIIEKDLKAYRYELFSTYLIGQRILNDNLRKKLLKNHNNKYDLFIHIFKSLDNSIHELCVLNNITYKELKKNEINGLIHQAKEQLIKIINKYVNDMCNSFLLEEQKGEILNDSTYLIDGLSNNKKNNNRRDSLDSDKQLDKILKTFEKYDIDSNLRYHIQNIRNTEYLQLEVTIDKFTDMLNQLYMHMDKDDRNDIYDKYSHHPMIKEIHFNFINEKKCKDNKQLMLFPYTNDEKTQIRVEKLTEIAKSSYLLDNNLLYTYKILIENIVFQNNESIPWKKTVYITRENRLKKYEKKKIIVESFFNYVIDKEEKQQQFSPEEMAFLQSLIYKREYIYK